ncbi:MAG: 3-dehydroquinate synthase [Acidobacteriaceae bacterium]
MPRTLPQNSSPAAHATVPKREPRRASRIALKVSSAAYTIHIGGGLLASLSLRLKSLTRGRAPRLFVVTTPEVWRLWSGPVLASFAKETAPVPLFLPSGEAHKRLSSVERLAEELAAGGADRDSLLLALGGGIVGDVTGFLAAIYMRGIGYVQLPTTFLAQVDSSIGGKTGVNLRAGKNLVGSFHHPLAVLADTDTLTTLPGRELRAGLHESIKAAVIRSPRLFRLLDRGAKALLDEAHPEHTATLTRVVTESVRIKAEVVALDERESGLRMILNFGHTLGHAIETATGYKQLLHGEAVAWGMVAATRLALARGVLSSGDASRIEQTILSYGPLPRFKATAARLVELTARDKKTRSGTRSFILPTSIGKVEIVRDVTDEELLRAAASMLSVMQLQPGSKA